MAERHVGAGSDMMSDYTLAVGLVIPMFLVGGFILKDLTTPVGVNGDWLVDCTQDSQTQHGEHSYQLANGDSLRMNAGAFDPEIFIQIKNGQMTTAEDSLPTSEIVFESGIINYDAKSNPIDNGGANIDVKADCKA